MRALAILFASITVFATPAPVQAGFWGCLCQLTKPKCAAPAPVKLSDDVPPHGLRVLPNIEIGDSVRLQVGKAQHVEGVILSANFEALTLGTVQNGKPTKLSVKLKKIRDIEFLEKTEVDPAQFNVSEAVFAQAKRLLTYRKNYIEFLKLDFWEQIKAPVETEIAKLRQLPDKQARQEYLHKTGQEIMTRIMSALGAKDLGFHFNLNGGSGHQYVDRGGIRISRGDITVVYTNGLSGSTAEKIFLFRASKHSLYEILGSSNPKMALGGGRMGDTLNVFAIESKYTESAVKEGGIYAQNDISFDFDPAWAAKQSFNLIGGGLVGMPYSQYAVPPLRVFTRTRKRLDAGRLSRDEETLATMRYLEAVLTSGKNHIGPDWAFSP